MQLKRLAIQMSREESEYVSASRVVEILVSAETVRRLGV